MVQQKIGVALLTPTTWGEGSELDAVQLDCVTAVVLKVLDQKCKMPLHEQETMLAIYGLLHPTPAQHFDEGVHRVIDAALQQQPLDETTRTEIHRLRLLAEALIPKPVMKSFKARLRNEIFQKAS